MQGKAAVLQWYVPNYPKQLWMLKEQVLMLKFQPYDQMPETASPRATKAQYHRL